MPTAAQCTPQTDDEYIKIVTTTKERYANNPEPAKKRAKERYWFGGGKERAFDLHLKAAVFQKENEKAINRSTVSQALKLAAEAAGAPAAKVASHSLRRGGASAYIAAGALEEALVRFGRWTSEAYLAYVYPHAEVLHKALKKACKMVPRFELR